jgi:glycosyltransferase involved in cell wall biosynthesis
MTQVSILTPTYNQETYVGHCIESVLAQTFPDWEMLIVDDCSTDGTREVVGRYRDERLRLIRQPHRGIWKLRETYAQALNLARGSLIAILDGDDFWPSNKLEIQRGAFGDPDVVLSYGSYTLCDRKGTEIAKRRTPARLCGNVSGDLPITSILRNGFLPYSVTVMVRKETLGMIGGFVQPEYLPLVDLPTWLNITCGRRCVGFAEILGHYRVHGESVCRTFPSQIDEGHMRYGEEFLDRAWRSMGLSPGEWQRFRRELAAHYSHRRGFRRLQTREWGEAIRYFGRAMRLGGFRRRLKAGARLGQAIGEMIWFSCVRNALWRFQNGPSGDR